MTKNTALGVGTAKRLEGHPLREALLEQVADAVKELAIKPKLAVVLIGNNPESALYVQHKMRAAEKVDLETELHALPTEAGQDSLHHLLETLAADVTITSILLQLPLPAGWDTDAALARIPVLKDCDGISAKTIALRLTGNPDVTQPATPLGVMRLLTHSGQDVKGKNVVVIGQGRVAGKPMSDMLRAAGAHVAIIDRGTSSPASIARMADILISAAGYPGLVTAEWVKPGAVVIDIGLTRRDGAILGDVSPEVAGIAQWLTPVPGGVGPLTIASLLTNVVDGARRANGLSAMDWTVPTL